jgi:hypothetical protein
MNELADDVAGIISGEENDDVRNVRWLSKTPPWAFAVPTPPAPRLCYPNAASIACPLPFCLMSLVVTVAAHPTLF